MLRNLTGFPLAVYQWGRLVVTVPPDGDRWRSDTVPQGTRELDGGVEVEDVSLSVPALPPPASGVLVVVSHVAALELALAGEYRDDVVFPGPPVKDDDGRRTLGCRGLRRLAAPAGGGGGDDLVHVETTTVASAAGPSPAALEAADVRALLAAIDHTLRTGEHQPSGVLAFTLLCEQLGVQRDALVFDPQWVAAAVGAAA